MERALILVAVIVVVLLVGRWRQSRDGHVVSTVLDLGAADGSSSPPSRTPGAETSVVLEARDIVEVLAPTTPLALVEFTAPDCAPCAAVAAVLHRVAQEHPSVSVVQVDVAEQLDLARAHRIMRAPTTLLVSNRGELLGRVAGVPDHEDVERLVRRATERLLLLS
ncbi:thioredoxin family protein [Euzebya tangerina]|uniref:thioredoxin family protein n=1 Tax=Euzebya tangerina TaxID=591198 RepID=UPI000E30EA9B|nr:thioredoxin family protein [Euzebya tangerina]